MIYKIKNENLTIQKLHFLEYILLVSNCASKTLLFRFRAGSLAADTNGGGWILGEVNDELLRDLFLAFIWYWKEKYYYHKYFKFFILTSR